MEHDLITYLVPISTPDQLLVLKAAEELQVRLGKLRNIQHSGVKSLDNIMLELDANSQSAFTDINSEVSRNCSSMEDVIIHSSKSFIMIYSCFPFLMLFDICIFHAACCSNCFRS